MANGIEGTGSSGLVTEFGEMYSEHRNTFFSAAHPSAAYTTTQMYHDGRAAITAATDDDLDVGVVYKISGNEATPTGETLFEKSGNDKAINSELDNSPHFA